MSRRGRPLSVIRRKETTIALQPKYFETLEQLCYDPFFRKRRHGLRNETIETALDDYFAKHNIRLVECTDKLENID